MITTPAMQLFMLSGLELGSTLRLTRLISSMNASCKSCQPWRSYWVHRAFGQWTQAATYRLSGDRNPLHIDGATARRAGLDRPILHGLSTLGVVARALIHACCSGDAARLSSIDARFTAPVYPGETITTEIWNMSGTLHFRSSVSERKLVVIDHGVATMDAFAKI